MTSDRTCPRCTCVIVIPVLNREKQQTGWQCTRCLVCWEEYDLRPAIDSAAGDLPAIDPIRGGMLE